MSQRNDLEIAVIGMAGRFPKAKNIDGFWQNLINGVECISFFTDQELSDFGIDQATITNPQYVKARPVLEDAEWFDASFFGISPREAELMDPQQRVFLECAWEVLENAGYDAEQYQGLIGVYAGTGLSTYLINNLSSHPDLIGSGALFQTQILNDKDYLSTRVSYKLNLQGPSMVIQTACSTSLVAVHEACQALLAGECDIALAGGVRITVPQRAGYWYQEGGILSPDGHCRAFDARAQGTIGGNGVGIVVLKRLADAIIDGDRIQAVIKGSAINNDGSLKVGFTAPRVDGQAKAISTAQAVADVEPETITYIEAHGTGTPLGDPIEIAALKQAFGSAEKKYCAVGSVKTNVGHLDAAAGVTGLIKTILALKHGVLPPSLHFKTPNHQLELANSPFYVNATLKDWKASPRRAGVSSFGVGGTNAHVILEEALKTEDSSDSRSSQLLVLSAKTDTALEAATANFSDHLEKNPDLNLSDVAYTLKVGRRSFNHRRVVVCDSADDARRALKTLDPVRVFTGVHKGHERPIAFMFPGQGAQYPNMGRELYEHEPKFREQLDLCCEILKPHLNLDLRDLLYPDNQNAEEEGKQLTQTRLTQPALFVIEYSLAQLWMTWGIRPQAMIGHSIGEYVAACLAGVFSLEDALTVVAHRGRLMQGLPPGVMLAVRSSKEELQPLLADDLALAASNGPSHCVVAGGEESVERLQNLLAERGVGCRRLVTSHAFHSSMMDPILGPFIEIVKKVKLNAPDIPYISNLTGTWITAAQTKDPTYWAQHLRQTVRFSEGVRQLLQEPTRILLEVGPGQTLTTLAKQHFDKHAEHTVIPSWGDATNSNRELALLLEALGRVWIAGATVEWNGFYEQEKRYRVPLPTYPFERQRYWIEPRVGPSSQEDALVNKTDVADWFYRPSWKRSVPPELLAGGVSLEKSSSWLIFVDACGLGDEVVKRLELSGQDVISVRAGDRFEHSGDNAYKLTPGQRNDYDALLNRISAQKRTPERIVHLWGVSSTSRPTLDIERFNDAQETGFYSLLFLAQALSKLNVTASLRIDVVTSNMFEVIGGEKLCPEKNTILGPCKVIPRDLANTVCRTIDIIHESSSTDEQLVNQLVMELLAQPSDLTVAYRGKNRWVQTIEPIRWEQPVDATTPLKERGVYLITGGLGGVGLQLAEHLARTVQARLILTGRSGLPAKHEWESYLSKGGDPNADETEVAFSDVPRIKQSIEQELKIKPLNAYPQLQHDLNQLCSSYIYDYFCASGITLDRGHRYRVDELKTKLGVLPKFEKFYQRMLRVLAEDQMIELDGHQVHILKSSHEVDTSEKLHGELESQYPEFKGLFRLLRHCARHYPEALSGKIEAIGVLYPGGSSEFLNECEANTIEHKNGRIYQLLLREVIDKLVEESRGRKLRILEVGGGRGRLTKLIAPVLKNRNVEYHFTDIGKTFVVQAEAEAQRLGFDFMKFGLLDISRDPVAQGYERSSYDVIFGLDVVHATPRIEETIANLNGLLSASGHLLLVEGVRSQRWIDMVWGLAEGWWYFTDTDLRETSPLLSLERWENAFRSQGFEAVQGYPQAEQERSETDSALIVGRKPAGAARASDTRDSASISNRILKVKELEELGAEVMIASADVSNYDQMTSLIKEIRERFGEINGVIHAAGIEGGGLIQSTTREKTEQEFAAKVRGTLVLDSLLKNEKLDFFVLCSSHAAVTGALGQVGYSAANAFIDGFANFKASEGNNRTVSVNWGRWKNVGMAVGVEQRHQVLTGEEIDEQMTANQGLQAFTHLLSAKSVPQLIVSSKDFQVLPARKKQREQTVVEKVDLGSVAPSIHDHSSVAAAYVAPGNDVEQIVANIWQEVLGVERVGSHNNFFDLGGDSLIAIQVLSRLRKRFEVDLPVTSLFEAPTVSDLATMVVQKQLGQMDTEKLAEVLAEIKQLSKDEITELLTSEQNVVGERE